MKTKDDSIKPFMEFYAQHSRFDTFLHLYWMQYSFTGIPMSDDYRLACIEEVIRELGKEI